MSNNKNIDFKFTYLALKLLGKNLYSNAWAALSELVANGLDAKAKKVYVYIDMSEKRNSLIEVFDDGCGMSEQELENNYAKIGKNRRADQANSDSVMGRKGIGKLAALYLSRHYYVSSKTKDGPLLTYEMNFPEEKEFNDNETPELEFVSDIKFENDNFKKYNHGTMVHMENVDLRGYADFSMGLLNNVLSDFFSTDSLVDQEIYYKVVTNGEKKEEFKPIQKEIPFKNMVQILCFDEQTFDRLNGLYSDSEFKLPYKNLEDETYHGNTEVNMESIKNTTFESASGIKKEGKLTGWIGIHSSIKQEIAKINDSSFQKGKLYNPFKLRIYVRNKLAISDFLPIVNNTQVFSNFIEGEVGFDILDDNDFPDIATSSRQNMDENDDRVSALANTIKDEIAKLIKSRQKIREEMNKEENKIKKNSDNEVKKDFEKKLDNKINEIETKNFKEGIEIQKEDLFAVKNTAVNNIKGENIKNKYKIFFSHSSENKKVISFYYYLLCEIGAKEDEMFYTSKDNNTQVKINENLSQICKDNITDNNTFVFLYTTEEYNKSGFCMFEGGAVWATKTTDDFLLAFDEKENVPDFLNPGNKFLLEITKESDILSGEFYNKIVQTLNYLIEHLNKGRNSQAEKNIPTFDEVVFPDKVKQSNGEMPEVSKNIIEYWSKYVDKEVEEKAKKLGYILK